MAGLLRQVADIGISAASGIPQVELDRLRLQNEAIREQTAGVRQAQAIQSQEQIEQQRFQALSQRAAEGDDDALNQMFTLNPKLADQFFEGMGAKDQAHRESISRRAFEIQQLPFDQRRPAILKQATDIEATGGDASQTLEMLGMGEEEQNLALRATQMAALTTEQREKRASSASKLGQSVVVKGPDGELSFATPVLTGDQVSTQQTPISGDIVSRTTGETGPQRQQRDIETAGGKATATGISQRDQEHINVGQRQADGTAIVRRGLELLKLVGTGRPEALALSAKNLFGIAGADETELQANLGKAILSQLRSTFGAAFTENEGKRLESIESNFGKSTEGNIRLLQQTLKSMERDARRGISAATNAKDLFSVKEIEDALEFTLSTQEPAQDSSEDFDPALLELMTPEERALFGG